jgi:hypothetical protein
MLGLAHKYNGVESVCLFSAAVPRSLLLKFEDPSFAPKNEQPFIIHCSRIPLSDPRLLVAELDRIFAAVPPIPDPLLVPCSLPPLPKRSLQNRVDKTTQATSHVKPRKTTT